MEHATVNNPQAQNAQVQMTIQITRKETGNVEEYILTGLAEIPADTVKKED